MYKSKFLVANPVITDPIFAGKVVFLFKHNKKGAEGIILNSDEPIGQVNFGEVSKFLREDSSFEEFEKFVKKTMAGNSVPLHSGGPVNTPGIFFIHGHEDLHEQQLAPGEEPPEFDLGIPNSFGEDDEVQEFKNNLKIIDGVYFGSPMVFHQVIETGKMAENKFRFYTGMSTWAPGQLEHEIAGGAWRIMDSDSEIFFDKAALDTLAVGPKPEKPKWDERFKPSMN